MKISERQRKIFDKTDLIQWPLTMFSVQRGIINYI